MRLIHITDPHLTSLAHWRPGLRAGKRWLSWLSWQTGRRRRHRRERLDSLTTALAAKQPDAWAITGDLCQIGLDAEAAEARDWLNRLASPERTLLVPGNHDVFARDSDGPIRRRWADYLHVDPDSPQWPVTRRFEDLVLIGLNSAIVTPPLRAGGRLGADMRRRLVECLRAHRGRCRVVLIHHPPLPNTCKPRKALSDDAELTEILRQHGPALVLHGHLHRNREWALADGAAGMTRVFCTASASASGKQGAAAGRMFDIRAGKNGFEIEMRLMLLDAGGRVHEAEHQQWETTG